MSDQPEGVDLGSGFSYSLFGWHPDRDLNPQYDIPDVETVGATISYNGVIKGAVWFDTPEVRAIPGASDTYWTLVSLDPLHIEPSIQMYRFDFETKQQVPSHHGYIREGRWVSA